MELSFPGVCEQYFSSETLTKLWVNAPKHVTPKARLFAYLKNKSLARAELNSSCSDVSSDAGNLVMRDSSCAYRNNSILGEHNSSAHKSAITDSSCNRGQFFKPSVTHNSSNLCSKISFFASVQNLSEHNESRIVSSPRPRLSCSVPESHENCNPCESTNVKNSETIPYSHSITDDLEQTEESINKCKGKQAVNVIPKTKADKQEKELKNWSITLSRDGLMRLNGFVNGRKYQRRTNAVVKRHSKYLIQTSSGNRYKLIGLRQTNPDEANALYEPFLLQFNKGFPWNWREILQVLKTEMKSSDEKDDKLKTSIPDVKEPPVNDETLSHGQRRRSAYVEKKPIQENELQRSRHSGRIVYPPLAYWANQRVIIQWNRDGFDKNVHVQGNRNELNCPVLVNFQEQKKKRSKSASHQHSRVKDSLENSKVCKQPAKRHSEARGDTSRRENRHDFRLKVPCTDG